MSGTISVVVPTLNAASGLAQTLACVEGAPVREIVVSDGGSVDGTMQIAEDAGAIVVIGPKGRGGQLGRGADVATGDWLLFLHADTVLSASWGAEAGNYIAMPSNQMRAGYFRLLLNSQARQARRVERLVRWRCRTFGLPYGDQGLLISRRLYDEIGGYDMMPLMEDVSLVRRIGRKCLHEFEAAATTSAEKFERDGWTLRPVRNVTVLILYLVGVPASLIAKLY
jgi:rSAM/selenodomain-associated transferase 2